MSTLHRSGFLRWSASTYTSKKAWVSFFVTWSINRVWKYSCSGRDAPLSTSATLWVYGLCKCFSGPRFSLEDLECLEPLLAFFCFLLGFHERQTFLPMIFLNTCTTNWSKHWTQGSLRNIMSEPQHPHKRMMGPRGFLGGFAALEGAWPHLGVSIWVELSVAIPLIWLLDTSSVLAISKVVSRVSVASFSRSLVCVRLQLEPKIRASMMCSSGFVNWHSPTWIRIFFTNESTVSSGSCFKVRSLYFASLKLLFGDSSQSASSRC